MAFVALILVLAAVACFLLTARPPGRPVANWLPLGLALLALAWLAQSVIVGGWHWFIR